MLEKINAYLNFSNWIRHINTKKRDFIVKKWTNEEDIIVLNKDISLQQKIDTLQRTSKSINIRIWRLKNNFIKS